MPEKFIRFEAKNRAEKSERMDDRGEKKNLEVRIIGKEFTDP